MQYLGGKSRICKFIANKVNSERNSYDFWDPFCGGLSVSVSLGGRGTISDSSYPLISLYNSIYNGWVPPDTLSEHEYHESKNLPDDNPVKAFAGFGCSFGAKWFGGYARSSIGSNDVQKYAKRASKSLIRDVSILKSRGCTFKHLDFMQVNPCNQKIVIYCDPPYENTTKYNGVSKFDHQLFWKICQQWANVGVNIFVSEYTCPIPHEVVWHKEHKSALKTSNGKDCLTNEYLFKIL